jgi:hypothetical protein
MYELWIARKTTPRLLEHSAAFPDWLPVQHLACDRFDHSTFTDATWERLCGWLQVAHNRKGNDFLLSPVSTVIRLLRAPNAGSVLTDEDRYILNVLQAHKGKALTFQRIITASVLMNKNDRHDMPRRLSDSTIRKRVPILEGLHLVSRPSGTQRKGIAITDAGTKSLAESCARKRNGNPTEKTVDRTF